MTTGNCRDVAEEIKGRIEELRQERDEACVERDKLKARVNELEGRAPECKVVLALKARAKDLKDWEGQWEAAADRVNKQSAELTALRANHEQAARRVADVLWRARPHGITDREKWVATAAKTILSELRAESAEVIATVTLKGAPPREATVEIEKPASACPDCAVPMIKTSDPLGENVRWVCERCGMTTRNGKDFQREGSVDWAIRKLCEETDYLKRLTMVEEQLGPGGVWLALKGLEAKVKANIERLDLVAGTPTDGGLIGVIHKRLKSLEANVAGHERAIGVLVRMVFRAAYTTTQGFSRLTEEDAKLLEKWKP